MILHLIPVSESGDPLEGLQEDIMVLPHEQQPTTEPSGVDRRPKGPNDNTHGYRFPVSRVFSEAAIGGRFKTTVP
jgi:hypothetical protein